MTDSTTSIETLAVEGLSTLNRLLETSGEVFASLSKYSTSKDNTEEAIRREVMECHKKYKGVSGELKSLVEKIDDIQEEKRKEAKLKENNMDIYDPSSDPIIVELIKTRSSLLQESDTQRTHLTNLLEQTYKLQFLIQTLLASSEQE
ncbi:4708_t:CDS:2, partial [Acaulospora colombiana]